MLGVVSIVLCEVLCRCPLLRLLWLLVVSDLTSPAFVGSVSTGQWSGLGPSGVLVVLDFVQVPIGWPSSHGCWEHC